MIERRAVGVDCVLESSSVSEEPAWRKYVDEEVFEVCRGFLDERVPDNRLKSEGTDCASCPCKAHAGDSGWPGQTGHTRVSIVVQDEIRHPEG